MGTTELPPLPVTPDPWRRLSERLIYDNPWIRLTEYEVLNPAGQAGIYGEVHFHNLAVGLVPLDAEGCVWLVGQYRFPLRQYSWEIPEGGGPLDVDPETSARRELAEETGLSAGKMRPILTMHLSNSVSDERAIIYLAQELTAGTAEPEETEDLRVLRIPLAEALARVFAGEITDSLTVAGLMRVELMRLAGEL